MFALLIGEGRQIGRRLDDCHDGPVCRRRRAGPDAVRLQT
jgi:hypothetical protein